MYGQNARWRLRSSVPAVFRVMTPCIVVCCLHVHVCDGAHTAHDYLIPLSPLAACSETRRERLGSRTSRAWIVDWLVLNCSDGHRKNSHGSTARTSLSSCYPHPQSIAFKHLSSRPLHTCVYDKPFGLVCIGYRRPERNAAIGWINVHSCHTLLPPLPDGDVLTQ